MANSFICIQVEKDFDFCVNDKDIWKIMQELAGCKIYYCRLVRLGLWETFHYKPCWNVFPTRILGTLAVKAFECSHNICGNNLHN